jgi:L-ascorbate metabolism protein UlaG (beta-lactamase superfamily)
MPPMDQLPRLTFLGHSTVLIELAGLRILTDPVLFDRIGPLRRVASSLGLDLYAGIDLVLVSHLHLDHFDVPSLRLLGPDVRVVVPSGAGPLLGRLGFEHVIELGPREGLVSGSVSVTATAAVHGGFRPPFGPRAAAVGYLIETGATRIYFAGDTDLFAGMAELAPDLDVALLPVWGWGPSLGPGHLDPKRAAQALRLLRPRYAIPIHWGTLWPLGFGRVRPGRLAHPPLEFAALAAETHPEVTVLVTPPGESVSRVPRPTTGRSGGIWTPGHG